MSSFKSMLAFAVLLAATLPATGQGSPAPKDRNTGRPPVVFDINTVGVMSVEGSSFAPDEPGIVRSDAWVSTPPPLGRFIFSGSTEGEIGWNVVWEAPADQFIEITPPAGALTLDVVFLFFAGGDENPGGFSDAQLGADVQLVPGSPPLVLSDERVLLTGPGSTGVSAVGQVFNEDLIPGQTYRFTSVSFSTVIPASYDVDLDSAISEFRVLGVAQLPDTASDAGQWVRVVPEPTSLALLGLGGLLVSRHRQARRM